MVMKGWDGLDLSLMDEEHNRGTAVVPGLGHEPALWDGLDDICINCQTADIHLAMLMTIRLYW